MRPKRSDQCPLRSEKFYRLSSKKQPLLSYLSILKKHRIYSRFSKHLSRRNIKSIWASVIAGGLAPLIATALLAAFGSGYAVAAYILFCANVSIIAMALLPA